MKRKIVQIAVAGLSGHGLFLYALGDDGSLWVLTDEDGWKRIPNLPTT